MISYTGLAPLHILFPERRESLHYIDRSVWWYSYNINMLGDNVYTTHIMFMPFWNALKTTSICKAETKKVLLDPV